MTYLEHTFVYWHMTDIASLPSFHFAPKAEIVLARLRDCIRFRAG